MQKPNLPTRKKAIALGFGHSSDDLEKVKSDLIELEDLIYSVGWDLVGSTYQKSDKKNARTLIGAGKIEDLKSMIEETGAEAVVFDHSLTGSQNRNLSKELGDVVVADRSQIIIDIFAQRAKTKEGKLQVELARLVDELPRMVGGWHGSLSRLGGGIGTRGPGESALETDRRTIRSRISFLRKKLKDVEKHRKETKKRRQNQILKVALVGYTNAGKSTLMNQLTEADTHTEDQLFATLDPLTRRVHTKELGEVVVTDTVGFINKIPTHLIEAFKATLEESSDADILLHVIDTSDSYFKEKSEFIEELLEDFGWSDKPILHVYNKLDLLDPKKRMTFYRKPPFLLMSAIEEIPDSFWSQVNDVLHQKPSISY